MVRLAFLAFSLLVLTPAAAAEASFGPADEGSPWSCSMTDFVLLLEMPWWDPNWIHACTANDPTLGPAICRLTPCEDVDAFVESLAPPVHYALCLTTLCPEVDAAWDVAYHTVMEIVDDLPITGR